MTDIKLLRLVTGEDIIAEATLGTTDWTMKNPIVVVAMPGPAGQPPNIGFAPWMPYSKNRTMTVWDNNVICVTEPLEQFVAQYKAINSKLDIPVVNKLILPGK